MEFKKNSCNVQFFFSRHGRILDRLQIIITLAMVSDYELYTAIGRVTTEKWIVTEWRHSMVNRLVDECANLNATDVHNQGFNSFEPLSFPMGVFIARECLSVFFKEGTKNGLLSWDICWPTHSPFADLAQEKVAELRNSR